MFGYISYNNGRVSETVVEQLVQGSLENLQKKKVASYLTCDCWLKVGGYSERDFYSLIIMYFRSVKIHKSVCQKRVLCVLFYQVSIKHCLLGRFKNAASLASCFRVLSCSDF